MADQSDVEAALVALAANALYPLGTANGSITGAVFRVYRGWPGNAALEGDLAAGILHISVVGVPGPNTPLEQYPASWEIPNPLLPSLSVAVAGTAVTFGGIATEGLLAGILADDDGFAYRTRSGDSPDLVAASLAAIINEVRIATVSGPAVTVPGTTRLIGRVVADQAALMPTRRQRAEFRLTCWCGDPVSRDVSAGAIDAALAQIAFIPLPDGSVGRLQYVRNEATDDLSTLPLYRRELTYSVDYTTTVVQTQPSMLFGIFSAAYAGGNSTLHLS
jgi:hypothetical protein